MKRTIITALAVTALMADCLISKSCANTTTAPSGGPKDTLPPVLKELLPANYATEFPRTGGKIAIEFDEYTVVKTATDITLSPPQKKKPKTQLKGKKIVVTFQDTLNEDCTYVLDFGQALADNNEGNLAPRLVYTFSTGSTIDSMYFTGSLIDSKTLQPVKDGLVAIYSDLSDSACFNKMPDAVCRSDEWGFFSFRSIKPIPYRLYAYKDEDNDFKYNPDGDYIAFFDSTITPVKVVRDSIYELQSFDMLDTAGCQKRAIDYTMATFNELQSVQYLQNSGRKSDKHGFLKFSAADVQISKFSILGIESEQVLMQYNPTRDSIDFWIDSKYKMEDSLIVSLEYLATDSTGNLSPKTERLALAVQKKENSGGQTNDMSIMDNKSSDSGKKGGKEVKDTTFNLTVDVRNETVEQEGIAISSELPIVEMRLDSLKLIETNLKNQSSPQEFTFARDSMDIRKYIVRPKNEIKKGYKYELIIPHNTFFNLDRLSNVEAKCNFELPDSDNKSSLTLLMVNVTGNFFVELVNEKKDNVFRKYTISCDTVLFFPYLDAGNYAIRITEDNNGNGIWDTGNLLRKVQPERVRLYHLSKDVDVFMIPEKVDLEQGIDVKKMFE